MLPNEQHTEQADHMVTEETLFNSEHLLALSSQEENRYMVETRVVLTHPLWHHNFAILSVIQQVKS
jgi:hypothetical protein